MIFQWLYTIRWRFVVFIYTMILYNDNNIVISDISVIIYNSMTVPIVVHWYLMISITSGKSSGGGGYSKGSRQILIIIGQEIPNTACCYLAPHYYYRFQSFIHVIKFILFSTSLDNSCNNCIYMILAINIIYLWTIDREEENIKILGSVP